MGSESGWVHGIRSPTLLLECIETDWFGGQIPPEEVLTAATYVRVAGELTRRESIMKRVLLRLAFILWVAGPPAFLYGQFIFVLLVS